MKTQNQTSQPTGGGNSITTQHWAETAVIGEDTRHLLVIWGKLSDAAEEYSNLVYALYGTQTDQMLEGFMDSFSKVSDEVLKMIPTFIVDGCEGSRGKQAEI